MKQQLTHLPPHVAGALRGYYGRRRLYYFLRVASGTAALYLLLALAAMHLDRFLFLDLATRVSLFWLVHGGAAAAGIGYLLIVAWRRPSVQQVAYALQNQLPPDAHEMFVTLDSVATRGAAAPASTEGELLEQLQASADDYSRTFSAAKLVRDRVLRGICLVLLLEIVIAGLLCIPASYQFPLMVQRLVQPTANLPKPSFVKLRVTTPEAAIGRGGEAVLMARLEGEIPAVFRWILAKVGTPTNQCLIALRDGGQQGFAFDAAEQTKMSRVERRLFLYTRGQLQDSFSFQLRCGDAQSRIETVEVVAQPQILDLKLHVTSPAYVETPPQTVTQWRQPLSFLAGSKVRVTFRSDQPAPTRKLQFEGREDAPELAWDEAALAGSFEFTLNEDTTFEVRLVNQHGFANVEPAKVTIGIMEDAPPGLRLEYPSGDLQAVPAQLVPFQAEIEDDLGLTEVVFQYFLNPDSGEEAVPRELPIEVEVVGKTNLALKANFQLDKTGAAPGDVVLIRLRARDNNGSDGLSREIQVDIVPFTRDENERLRLASLRFLTNALAQTAESAAAAKPSDKPSAAVPHELYADFLNDAKKLRLGLASAPSLRSLRDILEREQHFTDRPRHKGDLRRLAGLLAVAGAPFASDAAADPQAVRAAQLQVLAGELLPRLTQLRWLKNITWRYLGMYYEAARLRGQLGDLANATRTDALLAAAAKKRAELFSTTLQGVGGELIELARRTDALNSAKIAEQVGQLNTDSYYLRRGSVGRRLANLDAVERGILGVLSASRGAFLPLARREQEGRDKLERLHAQGWRNLAAGPGPKAEPAAWYANAEDWLMADARMTARDPFASSWDGFVSYVLGNMLLDLGSQPPAARAKAHANAAGPARDLLELAPDVARLPENEARALDELARDWEEAAVWGQTGISTVEKRFESAVLAVEAALAKPGAEVLVRRPAKVLAAVPLNAETLAATGIAPERQRLRTSTLRPTRIALRGLIHERLGLAPIDQVLVALVDSMNATQQQLDSFLKAIGKGDADDLQQRAPGIRTAVDVELVRLRRLATRLYLELTLLGGASGDRELPEMLLIRVRQTLGRYAARYRLFLASQRSFQEGTLKTDDLASLGADVQRLSTLHQTNSKNVAKLLTAYRNHSLVDAAEKVKYPTFEHFARTRRFVDAANALAAGRDRRATALALLREFPEAGLEILAANAGLVELAAQQVALANAALNRTPLAAAAYHKALDAANEALGRLHKVMTWADAGDNVKPLAAALDGLRGQTAKLRFGRGSPSRVEINRKRFAIGELARGLKNLGHQLQLAATPEAEEKGFRGGPPEVWNDPWRMHAERSRRRLLTQASHARRAFLQGVHAALAEPPANEDFEAACAWSRLLAGWYRSELYGLGGVRLPKSRGDDKGDPRLRFLMAELEEAMKNRKLKNYTKLTKEYLTTVRDFLRY